MAQVGERGEWRASTATVWGRQASATTWARHAGVTACVRRETRVPHVMGNGRGDS